MTINLPFGQWALFRFIIGTIGWPAYLIIGGWYNHNFSGAIPLCSFDCSRVIETTLSNPTNWIIGALIGVGLNLIWMIGRRLKRAVTGS